MKSYLLIRLGDRSAQWFDRGMVVDIRDASRPLGTDEKPPLFGVVWTDQTVDQLRRLLQPAGEWLNPGTIDQLFQLHRVRQLRINIDSLPERIPPGVRGRLFRLLAGARVARRLENEGRANLMTQTFQPYEELVDGATV